MHYGDTGNQVQRRAKAVARDHEDEIQLAAKIGWTAKGALYVTLGVLALMVAIGEGGSLSGSEGAIQWVARQPFGTVLLAMAGVGFICYALWRLVQVGVDPERHGSTGEMIAKRVGWGVSAAIHLALAIASFQMIAGGGSGSSNGKQVWLSEALSYEWGLWLIGALGLVVIGVGLAQFKQAYDLDFMADVSNSQMSPNERDAFRWVGRIGLSARGVVFPIIGFFVVKAAVNANPGEAKGMEGALTEIAQAGWLPLAVTAVGLVAYGVLQLFFAKYRTVDVA